MKSRVYKIDGSYFRYDFDRCVVEHVYKADNEMLEDNKEWQAKYHKDLWEIDEGGYITMNVAGLLPEHWKDKETRTEYLEMWAAELNEEARYLAEDFIANEM